MRSIFSTLMSRDHFTFHNILGPSPASVKYPKADHLTAAFYSKAKFDLLSASVSRVGNKLPTNI